MPKLYQRLASLVVAIENCRTSGNAEWERRHKETLSDLVRAHLPHGSGFDNGTTIDLARSGENRLAFSTSFHHMNDNGFYDGWTEHDVVVVPSLAFGFTLKITGRDRRQIKDYIHDAFSEALSMDVEAFERVSEAPCAGGT
jgi:hypothetical protein